MVAILLLLAYASWLTAGEIAFVRSFETWLAHPRIIASTDPVGITYHPSGHLFISDSEINELNQFWDCENIFEISLPGDQTFNSYDAYGSNGTPCPPLSNFTEREPTGITYNWFDDYFYTTDDDEGAIFRYGSNFGAPNVSLRLDSGRDAEGITSAPDTGYLYVVEGDSAKILVYDVNVPPVPVFVYDFQVGDRIADPEGIAHSSISNHLFIVSRRTRQIFEYTTEGNLVQEYDMSHFEPQPINPAGLTFAPSSAPNDDPRSLNLYIVDRQGDNVADGIVMKPGFR